MNDLSDNIINEEVEIIDDVSGIKFRINSISEPETSSLKSKIKAAKTIQAFLENFQKMFDENIKLTGKKYPLHIGEAIMKVKLNVINDLDRLDFDYYDNITSTGDVCSKVTYEQIKKFRYALL